MEENQRPLDRGSDNEDAGDGDIYATIIPLFPEAYGDEHAEEEAPEGHDASNDDQLALFSPDVLVTPDARHPR